MTRGIYKGVYVSAVGARVRYQDDYPYFIRDKLVDYGTHQHQLANWYSRLDFNNLYQEVQWDK